VPARHPAASALDRVKVRHEPAAAHPTMGRLAVGAEGRHPIQRPSSRRCGETGADSSSLRRIPVPEGMDEKKVLAE
jgi:hypothetical protein